MAKATKVTGQRHPGLVPMIPRDLPITVSLVTPAACHAYIRTVVRNARPSTTNTNLVVNTVLVANVSCAPMLLSMTAGSVIMTSVLTVITLEECQNCSVTTTSVMRAAKMAGSLSRRTALPAEGRT